MSCRSLERGESSPKGTWSCPKPSGSLSPVPRSRRSLFFEGTGGWAASGLCEILVVTFALFPLPPRSVFGYRRVRERGGGGRRARRQRLFVIY